MGEYLVSKEAFSTPLLHRFKNDFNPPPLLVDHQQLLQLPLRQLLLQLPVLATPPRRLVVEVSHPAELLSGSLRLAQVGGGTLHRRVRCDRPAC